MFLLIEVSDLPSLEIIDIKRGAFTNTYDFDPSRFPNLEKLILPYYKLIDTDSFELNGLSKLKEFKCVDMYIPDVPDKYNETKSFRATNCNSLTEINIGDGCFFDYGGQFEVSNCPALISLSIGSNHALSPTFSGCSFTVKSSKLYTFSFCRMFQSIIYFSGSTSVF